MDYLYCKNLGQLLVSDETNTEVGLAILDGLSDEEQSFFFKYICRNELYINSVIKKYFIKLKPVQIFPEKIDSLNTFKQLISYLTEMKKYKENDSHLIDKLTPLGFELKEEYSNRGYYGSRNAGTIEIMRKSNICYICFFLEFNIYTGIERFLQLKLF